MEPEPRTVLPRTAVVIPVRGHSALLQGCLGALRAQEVPVDEIVVVDDSADGSLEELPGVTVLRSAGRGPYTARNLGWRRARADVVLFCDARSRPRPAWSRRLAEQFLDPGVVLAGSEVLVVGGDTPAAAAAALTQTFRLENYVARSFFRPYLPTCNLAARRSALEAVEGFSDVRSGGDADLCWRVLATTGGRLSTADDVLADWIPRDRSLDYLEQHYRYGRSNYELRARWVAEGVSIPVPRPLWRIAVRVAVAAVRLGAAALIRDDGRRATALVKATQAANEAGYAMAHRRGRDARWGALTPR